MSSITLTRLIKITAIAGNIVFIAWGLFNGLDSGWKGTRVEIASFIALILLLIVNSYLISTTLRQYS